MLKLLIITALLGMSIPAVLHRLTGPIRNYWVRFLVCAIFGAGIAVSIAMCLWILFPKWFGI